MNTTPNTTLGVSLNILASILFAAIFAYTTLLKNLNGQETYGWRIMITLPILSIFIGLKGYWPQVQLLFKRALNEKNFWLTRIASSFLVSFQLWLFMWAPSNGYGLSVSLGYFIMPITMVIVGRFVFKDVISRYKKAACLFAVIGILNQCIIAQALAWPTLAVCLGYPVYFWLRYKTNTNTIACLWLDMLLSLPVCFYFIFEQGTILTSLSASYSPILLVLGLGFISALALGLQSISAPHLSMSLFGLLIYVEPLLLLGVSFLIGEDIDQSEWPTYISIWCAIIALMIEGLSTVIRSKKQKEAEIGLKSQRAL